MNRAQAFVVLWIGVLTGVLLLAVVEARRVERALDAREQALAEQAVLLQQQQEILEKQAVLIQGYEALFLRVDGVLGRRQGRPASRPWGGFDE